MQAQEQRYYSPQEYLEREIASEYRHEYIDGQIIPMIGGTPNHNQLAGNFYAALNFALKRQPCRVFVTNQRLWIPKNEFTPILMSWSFRVNSNSQKDVEIQSPTL